MPKKQSIKAAPVLNISQ